MTNNKEEQERWKLYIDHRLNNVAMSEIEDLIQNDKGYAEAFFIFQVGYALQKEKWAEDWDAFLAQPEDITSPAPQLEQYPVKPFHWWRIGVQYAAEILVLVMLFGFGWGEVRNVGGNEDLIQHYQFPLSPIVPKDTLSVGPPYALPKSESDLAIAHVDTSKFDKIDALDMDTIVNVSIASIQVTDSLMQEMDEVFEREKEAVYRGEKNEKNTENEFISMLSNLYKQKTQSSFNKIISKTTDVPADAPSLVRYYRAMAYYGLGYYKKAIPLLEDLTDSGFEKMHYARWYLLQAYIKTQNQPNEEICCLYYKINQKKIYETREYEKYKFALNAFFDLKKWDCSKLMPNCD